MPLASISWTSLSSWSRTGLLELAPGQQAEGFDVLLAGLLDHVIGQRRHRRLLVPLDVFEIVAHELFVEAGDAVAGRVRGPRPEARRIGREHLVDENDLVACHAVLRGPAATALRRAQRSRGTAGQTE